MIFANDQVRLTPAELNDLRGLAARNGFVHNQIRTPAQLMQAALDGLSDATREDLLKYLQSSSLTAP